MKGLKIVIPILGHDMKVYLPDGTDITKDLKVSRIEVETVAGELTRAILTVLPSEVVAEIHEDEQRLIFKKHPNWKLFKEAGPHGQWNFPPQAVLGDDFERGI